MARLEGEEHCHATSQRLVVCFRCRQAVGTQWIALTRALAKLEDLREEVLGCLTPEGTMRREATASRDGKIDLLLIRMESLGLDLGEVRRSAASTFCKLADSCVNCECKERCERDLAYASAEMVTPDWENY